MPPNRLTGTYDFRFKTERADLDLAGSLLSWNDKIGMRLVSHEYLKRHGAEQEWMGASPGEFRMKLVFMGNGWAGRYRELVAAIRADPRGLLVHPLLGEVRVACRGIDDAMVEPGQMLDTIHVSISFVEDVLWDGYLVPHEELEGPSAKSAKVTSLSSSFTSLVAPFAAAATAATKFTAAVISYAAAALAAINNDSPDASLQGKLDEARKTAGAVIDAIRDDPEATSGAITQPAIDAAERLYDACVQLDESVAALKPVLVTFTVPSTMHVAAVAARFYGKDGRSKIDEILALNRIANPHAIQVGTTLRLAAPTVADAA